MTDSVRGIHENLALLIIGILYNLAEIDFKIFVGLSVMDSSEMFLAYIFIKV